MPPNKALAEFEAYASPHGAAYDIDEVFTAFNMRNEEEEQQRLLNPHGG